jgi:hypothetical protein
MFLFWFRNHEIPNFAVQEDLAEMAFDVRGKSRANNLLFLSVGQLNLLKEQLKSLNKNTAPNGCFTIAGLGRKTTGGKSLFSFSYQRDGFV